MTTPTEPKTDRFVERTADIAELSPPVAELFQWWQKQAGASGLIRRDTFDLLQLPPRLIPFATLCDWHPDQDDFYVRFWGTSLTTTTGFEMQGQFVSDMRPFDFRDRIRSTLMQVVEASGPYLGIVSVNRMSGYQPYEEIFRFPLFDEDDSLVSIVSVTHFFNSLREDADIFQNKERPF